MRRASWGVVALCVAARVAAADRVEGSSRGVELALANPRVTATLVDGTAHYRVRYDVVNPTRHADSARVQLELPPRALVVGVRHRLGDDGWIPGRLLAADAAAARFDRYLDAPFVATRSALLVTGGFEVAALSLSLVPARGRVTVEYELVAPACYARGRWYATYPILEPDPALTATGGRVESRAAVTKALGAALDEECHRFEGVDEGADARVLSWPGSSAAVTSRATTVGLGDADALSVIDVAVGPTLAPAPVRPAVVFVLDASRSMGDDGVAAQLAVVRGYLANARDARVEIVMVRRHATRLFGALVPAATALRRLAAIDPALLAVTNGSNLDAGLVLASSILAAARGPRRLVAFTDDELRPTLTDAQIGVALTGLPADAIAHVVLPGAGPSEVLRDFEHHLVEPIEPWGGIVAQVNPDGDPAPLRELVRPIRIEQVGRGDHILFDELFENSGARHIAVTTNNPAPLTGLIWGRRWSPSVADAPRDRIRAARLGLVTAVEHGDEAATIVTGLARAATDRTSFFGELGGWTPSGLPEDDELGMRSGGSWDHVCGFPSNLLGGIGHGGGTGQGVLPPPPPELPAVLRSRVEACAATVSADPWQVALDVAITGIEVVDVHVAATGIADAGARSRVEACALEAAWELELDPSYRFYRRSYAMTIAR